MKPSLSVASVLFVFVLSLATQAQAANDWWWDPADVLWAPSGDVTLTNNNGARAMVWGISGTQYLTNYA